jgi:CRP-like cAMP-binding protein
VNVEDALKAHPFARGASKPQVEDLMACAHLTAFREGAFIFREGGDASAVYLLLRGRVVLEQHVPGRGDIQLEELVSGDMLGLSWLFPGGRWLLDARVVEAVDAVELDAPCLHAAMQRDPVLGLSVAKHVVAQLYQRLERVRLQRLDVYRRAT